MNAQAISAVTIFNYLAEQSMSYAELISEHWQELVKQTGRDSTVPAADWLPGRL